CSQQHLHDLSRKPSPTSNIAQLIVKGNFRPAHCIFPAERVPGFGSSPFCPGTPQPAANVPSCSRSLPFTLCQRYTPPSPILPLTVLVLHPSCLLSLSSSRSLSPAHSRSRLLTLTLALAPLALACSLSLALACPRLLTLALALPPSLTLNLAPLALVCSPLLAHPHLCSPPSLALNLAPLTLSAPPRLPTLALLSPPRSLSISPLSPSSAPPRSPTLTFALPPSLALVLAPLALTCSPSLPLALACSPSLPLALAFAPRPRSPPPRSVRPFCSCFPPSLALALAPLALALPLTPSHLLLILEKLDCLYGVWLEAFLLSVVVSLLAEKTCSQGTDVA
ncbi:hypothetical protein BJV78DRAFT_1289509, partial [Lactifluus subvellereus]